MSKFIAVFISGNGSNLQALIDNQIKGSYTISLVVSNKSKAFGLERAKAAGIPTIVKLLKPYMATGKTRVEYDIELANEITKFQIDLIVLAGFMHILSSEFISLLPQIINLHPALPGAYDGTRAIERAFEDYGKGFITETGVMIHRCIPEVDSGAVICQERVEIKGTDLLKDLEDRIHLVEHRLIVQGTELALMML